jgi:hypothetical protein
VRWHRPAGDPLLARGQRAACASTALTTAGRTRCSKRSCSLRAATARRWTQLVYCPEGGTFTVTGGRLALCLFDLLAIVTGLLGQGVQAEVAREVFVLGRAGGDHPGVARSGHCPTASEGEEPASVPRPGQAHSPVLWSGRGSSLGVGEPPGALGCRRRFAVCGRRKARCGAGIRLLRGREVPRGRGIPGSRNVPVDRHPVSSVRWDNERRPRRAITVQEGARRAPGLLVAPHADTDRRPAETR